MRQRYGNSNNSRFSKQIGTLLIPICLLVSACHPIADAIDETTANCEAAARLASEQAMASCQLAIDEAIEDVPSALEEWVTAQQDELISELAEELEARMTDYERELFTRIGCVPVATLPGWDCTGTALCSVLP